MTLALLLVCIGFTIMYAGQYAWISLFVVVLFLFRKIYGEVVEQSLLMVDIMSY
jgi:hypothetical protein